MQEIKFRQLNADELEVRKSGKKDGYVSLLIYKDSRCDMRILDETVGSDNWEVDYKREGDTLLCGISIYSERHQRFLTKWAAGSESNIEAVKGEQSDALKRSAFAWGLGRALYTAPKINVPEEQAYGKLSVREIAYEGERISKLTIVNGRGNVIYSYPGGVNTKYIDSTDTTAPKTTKEKPGNNLSNSEKLKNFCSNEKLNPDTDNKVLLKFYEYYKDRVDGFDRSPNYEKMWEKWLANERK